MVQASKPNFKIRRQRDIGRKYRKRRERRTIKARESMLSSPGVKEVDIQDKKLMSALNTLCDPEDSPVIIASVTPGSIYPVITAAEAEEETFVAKFSPLPDGEEGQGDNTPGNPAIVEEYKHELPMKLEISNLKWLNKEWEIWIDLIGRPYFFNPATGARSWTHWKYIPAHPILHRTSQEAELKKPESKITLPIRLRL